MDYVNKPVVVGDDAKGSIQAAVAGSNHNLLFLHVVRA